MTVRIWLVLIPLLLGASDSIARQSSAANRTTGGYLAYHEGAELCSRWTAQPANSARRRASVTWVYGFVSGAGWSGTQTLRKTDDAELVREVSAFCREHPELPLHKAAEQLVLTLERP